MAVPSDGERNLVQELARVITQAIPCEKSAPPDNHFREQTASGGYDEEPGLPRAPQLAREQACELHDDSAYAVHYKPCTAKRAQQKETRPVRRTRGSVIAIVGLAFFGATGAFGYRGMFSGSALPMPPPTIASSIEPHKIPLASDAPQAKTRRKAKQVGADIS